MPRVLQIRADIAYPTTITATACAADASLSQGHEQCGQAFVAGAGNKDNKYYTWDRINNPDVWLDLGASHHLTEFEIRTANDVANRDPTGIQIFASDASKVVGTQLADLTVACPLDRKAACPVMRFSATPAHRYVVVRFAATRSGTDVQVSRAFFRGFAASPPS